MGKMRETILILGDGPTEFYYFQSLRDIFRNLNIQPDYPKHSSLLEMERNINKGISEGYSHIYCIIDMDTKDKDPERTQYLNLKNRFANVIDKPEEGIHCEVEFFETHLCTELFFLYYFRYTSQQYFNQDVLLKDLNKNVEYKKKKDFFMKCKGLHPYFERNGGLLTNAVANANKSLKEKSATGRTHTYSGLGLLIQKLSKL